MSHTCLRTEELPDLLERPDDDSRRREVERCARCRSLLASYREFTHPSAPPVGADPAGADVRLAAALDAEIFGGTDGTPERWEPSPAAARPPRTAPRPDRGSFFRRMWQPVLRPAWGAAVVLLALWGVRSTGWLESRGRTGTELRAVEADADRAVRLLVPVTEASGDLRLGWTPVSEADRYDVVIHGTGYVEQLRLDAGGGSTVLLAAEAQARLAGAHEQLYWRVIAYHRGDPIAESAIEPLAGPAPR